VHIYSYAGPHGLELYDLGFAGDGMTTPETSGQTMSRARPWVSSLGNRFAPL